MKIFIPPKEVLSDLTSDTFEIWKDFKKLAIDVNVFVDLVNEQILRPPMQELPGATLVGDSNTIAIVKHYLNFGNLGKKRGLRLIGITDRKDRLFVVLHIYSKSDKKDLTNAERKSLKNILSEYMDIKPIVFGRKE